MPIYAENLANQAAEHHNTENTIYFTDTDQYLDRKIQTDT